MYAAAAIGEWRSVASLGYLGDTRDVARDMANLLTESAAISEDGAVHRWVTGRHAARGSQSVVVGSPPDDLVLDQMASISRVFSDISFPILSLG